MNPLKIVIIAVVLVLLFMLVKYITSDPYTLSSVTDAKTLTVYSKDDLAKNDAGVPSSNFAYSVWFYVNAWNYRYSKPKVIFGRMSSKGLESDSDVEGVHGKGPCPVVTLMPMQNNITVSLSCYPGINEQIDAAAPGASANSIVHSCMIANVPIQKWVHFTMSVFNRTMDLYIDGKLVKTCLLPGVANVNSGSNLFLTPAGGFDGWTSKLQYYSDSINPQDVWNIYSKGYDTWLGNIFGSYEVKVSLLENGETQNSMTF